MRFTICLRNKEWTAFSFGDDLQQVGTSGTEKLKFDSLTPEEMQAVYKAEKKAAGATLKHYEAEQRRAREQVDQGAVQLRNFVWHAESDHLWRSTREGIKKLNFSELTNQETAAVLEAKEREVQNRGVVGFLRRLSRKLDEF